MSLLGLIFAGIAGAVIHSAVSNNKTTSVEYPSIQIVNEKNNNSDNFENVQSFMKAYNSLSSTCTSIFGKDEYNSIKKLANAIKFNSHRDDIEMQKITTTLYDVVTLRNRFISHNNFGIAVIPIKDYVDFMNKMESRLKNNKQTMINAYRKFCNYKNAKQIEYKNW